VDQTGIVIGGGLSGMTAALALANQGFSTHLIEQANRLGGTLHDIRQTLEQEDIAAFTAGLIAQGPESSPDQDASRSRSGQHQRFILASSM